jgi:deoxycytidylate deaminase
MDVARWEATATLLGDGRVLIVGGFNGNEHLASAELYDPSTGAFSHTGGMQMGRSGHTATLLEDGRVLAVGGDGDNGPLASAETYDPTIGSFQSTGSMSHDRHGHTATMLHDGRVMIVGGWANNINTYQDLTIIEIFDPATGIFRRAGSIGMARDFHTATLLPDGRVLIAGGYDESRFASLTSVELVTP